MGVYVVAFAAYPGEVKIGRSSETLRRVQEQADDHGEIVRFVEYTHETIPDAKLERTLLHKFRGRMLSTAPLEKISRKGWTEFVETNFCAITEEAERMGCKTTGLTSDNFIHVGRKPNNSYRLNVVEKCIKDLTVADSMILTCLLNNVDLPPSYDGFINLCEGCGEHEMVDASSAYHFELATKMYPRYRYGIFQGAT